MIIPPYLKKGDQIALLAPAKFIPQAYYSEILQRLKNQGLKVKRGASTYDTHGPFAGSDKLRLEDLQQALDDEHVRGILCLRGGYGSIRLLDKLDFTRFVKNPKWLIGYSDISTLHNVIHNMDIASIHGPMAINATSLAKQNGVDEMFRMINGEFGATTFESDKWNIEGHGSGNLVGGNLAVLCSLIGTKYDIDTRGKVLFIEEVGEYLYRFERLMYQLKLSGKLEGLSGLIVGGLTQMEDNKPAFDKSLHEIVASMVAEYKYPVAFNFQAGHGTDNYPLMLGAAVKLLVEQEKSTLTYE